MAVLRPPNSKSLLPYTLAEWKALGFGYTLII